MILLLSIIVILLMIIHLKWSFSYWERKGYPYLKPNIPFGELQSVMQRKQAMGMALYDAYKSSCEKVVGIYLFMRPVLLVRDAELAHNILTKDFGSFHDRGVYVDEKNDPLSSNLFGLRGKSWKNLRTKLSPSFSPGKLKAMFGNVEDISVKMLNHLNEIVPIEGSAEVEARSIFQTYAIDIIGSVIFGMEVNSFKNADNEFYNIHKKVSQPTLPSVIRNTAAFLHPGLEKLFVSIGWKEHAQHSMRDLVKRTIEFRDKHNIVRRDMLQMLLQLRNSGKINEDDNVWTAEKTSDAMPTISIETISAQMFVFYAAGAETTASAAAFTIYELSQYPEILTKAQRDVEQALLKHDGKLSYESIHDMKYLDLCIMETIRKYPGLPMLNRECTQDYPVPGTDKIIQKGTPVIISLMGIHRDDEYFSNALTYDPERFLDENRNYNPRAYMPFGEGPRQCIAQRMGKLNVKVALAQILTNFNIEKRTKLTEIEFDNFGLTILPKDGVKVHLSRKQQMARPY